MSTEMEIIITQLNGKITIARMKRSKRAVIIGTTAGLALNQRVVISTDSYEWLGWLQQRRLPKKQPRTVLDVAEPDD